MANNINSDPEPKTATVRSNQTSPSAGTEATDPAKQSEITVLNQKASKRSRATRGARTKKARGAKRPFPAETLEKAIQLPVQIKEKNGGNPWATRDLAQAIGISSKGAPFFYLTAASRDYGLTEGTRYAEKISLAETGRHYVFAKDKQAERAALQEAFFNVPLFKSVYEHYKEATLPELKYLSNTLQTEFKLPQDYHEDFHRIYQENCSFVQRLGEISAAAPDRIKSSDGTVTLASPEKATSLRAFVILPFSEKAGSIWPRGFFSEVLNSLITPAAVEAGFKVETARREGSDVIQATIVNELLNADLVIADLTDHNPNVLFELGLRMAFEKPVALIRAEGTPPIFDVDNMLRVWSYKPNLWRSTLESDKPSLAAHVKGTWDNRKSTKTYMQLLKEQ